MFHEDCSMNAVDRTSCYSLIGRIRFRVRNGLLNCTKCSVELSWDMYVHAHNKLRDGFVSVTTISVIMMHTL